MIIILSIISNYEQMGSIFQMSCADDVTSHNGDHVTVLQDQVFDTRNIFLHQNSIY